MIFVAMRIRAQAGAEARMTDVMAEMMVKTRAEAGCVVYTYARDLADPELFHLTEIWESEAAMNDHIRSPHAAEFVERLARCGKIEFIRAWGGEVQKLRVRSPDEM